MILEEETRLSGQLSTSTVYFTFKGSDLRLRTITKLIYTAICLISYGASNIAKVQLLILNY